MSVRGVISRETRHCLDEYRGFRHVVRNVYAFNLLLSRLQELAGQLRECYLSVKSDLDEFTGFLDQLTEDGDPTNKNRTSDDK